MELLFIRHAESQFNAKETHDLDSALTKLGRKQAIDAAAFLKRKFDNIDEWEGYVSPFLRTLQTAKTINEHTNVKFKVDWGISEYGGDYSCTTNIFVPARKEKFPDFFKETTIEGWKMHSETEQELLNKTTKFLEKIQQVDGKYIIISHAMTIYTMINIIKGIMLVPKWDKRILNTSITWIVNNEIKYFARYVNSGKDPKPDGREILFA